MVQFHCSLTRAREGQRPEEVEKQLHKISKQLTETEVNIDLFKEMVKKGVMTNEVRHFVSNQAGMKRSDSSINFSLARKTMRSKLRDAYCTAHRLRQGKKKMQM